MESSGDTVVKYSKLIAGLTCAISAGLSLGSHVFQGTSIMRLVQTNDKVAAIKIWRVNYYSILPIQMFLVVVSAASSLTITYRLFGSVQQRGRWILISGICIFPFVFTRFYMQPRINNKLLKLDANSTDQQTITNLVTSWNRSHIIRTIAPLCAAILIWFTINSK